MSSTTSDCSEHPDTCSTVSCPLGILNTCNPGAWKRVGGIPLAARSLFHLNALGLKRVIVLWDSSNMPQDLKRWQGQIQLEYQRVDRDLPGTLLLAAGLADRFIYIDAGHLIDPRLIRTLVFTPVTTICHVDSRDAEASPVRAGFFTKEDLLVWARQGASSLIPLARHLSPDDIDPFCPEARGPATPYFLEIRNEREADEATRLIVRRQQKQVMDLPAQYLHPPFENALTYYLLKTPVTPNGVTCLVAVLGLLIAWLFWNGFFVSGALLTFLVDILDGVDGKLARTKLQFSRLGKHEDIIDYFYENSWYVALGVGLSAHTGGSLPMVFAAALVLADTADNIWYTVAGKLYGKSIDLFSPFDRNFRSIAGRRSIYGTLFIIGFPLGYPYPTFIAATLWALITAAIHGIRLFRYGRDVKKPEVNERHPS